MRSGLLLAPAWATKPSTTWGKPGRRPTGLIGSNKTGPACNKHIQY